MIEAETSSTITTLVKSTCNNNYATKQLNLHCKNATTTSVAQLKTEINKVEAPFKSTLINTPLTQ